MIKDLIQDYKDWTTRLAPRIILGIWHVSDTIFVVQ